MAATVLSAFGSVPHLAPHAARGGVGSHGPPPAPPPSGPARAEAESRAPCRALGTRAPGGDPRDAAASPAAARFRPGAAAAPRLVPRAPAFGVGGSVPWRWVGAVGVVRLPSPWAALRPAPGGRAAAAGSCSRGPRPRVPGVSSPRGPLPSPPGGLPGARARAPPLRRDLRSDVATR